MRSATPLRCPDLYEEKKTHPSIFYLLVVLLRSLMAVQLCSCRGGATHSTSRSGVSCEMKSSLLWGGRRKAPAWRSHHLLAAPLSVQGEGRVSGSCCLWEQSHSSRFVSVCYTFSIALVTWALLSGRGKAAITQAFHWAVTQTVTGVEMACVPLWQQVNKVMVQQATRTQNCRLSHRALAVHAWFL